MHRAEEIQRRMALKLAQERSVARCWGGCLKWGVGAMDLIGVDVGIWIWWVMVGNGGYVGSIWLIWS